VAKIIMLNPPGNGGIFCFFDKELFKELGGINRTDI